jgi:hypothetical protein
MRVGVNRQIRRWSAKPRDGGASVWPLASLHHETSPRSPRAQAPARAWAV